MTTAQIIVVAAAAVYVLIGIWHARRGLRMLRGILGNSVSFRAKLLITVLAITFGPFEIGLSVWKNRKVLRHSLLGYWPIIAHTTNLISHWGARREEFRQALHLELFAFVDQHMAETADCLKRKYGINVLDCYWRIKPIGGESLEELHKLAEKCKEQNHNESEGAK